MYVHQAMNIRAYEAFKMSPKVMHPGGRQVLLLTHHHSFSPPVAPNGRVPLQQSADGGADHIVHRAGNSTRFPARRP